MSKADFAVQWAEGLLVAMGSFLAARFTHSEQVATLGMAVCGAAVGGVISSMLGHVITGPGLEKIQGWKRWLVNFFAGSGIGFFGSWPVQEKWMPSYPVEIVGGLVAFVSGILAVTIFTFLWPMLLERLRKWTSGGKHSKKDPRRLP